MFTGIIEATGFIQAIEPKNGDARFVFNTGKLNLDDVELGDSIACNGTCLTVIEKYEQGFAADVSVETIKVTCFADYQVNP